MTRLWLRSGLALMTFVLILGGISVTLRAHPLGPLTSQQLAAARAGTAPYHNVDAALADGYTPLGFNAAEGAYEFVNFSLLDCTFDPAHPESLHYVESGNGLRLIGVEYAVPMACTSPGTPPQGFAGDDDVWEPEGDLPIWRLGADIWLGSKEGPFEPGDEGGSTH